MQTSESFGSPNKNSASTPNNKILPNIPKTPGLLEFTELIDSFSFDTTSPPKPESNIAVPPEKSSRLSKERLTSAIRKNKERTEKIHTESSSNRKITIESTIRTGILRSGKYFKRRSNSFSGFPCLTEKSNPEVIIKTKMSVDICKINQLVCTGIPLLTGENGPNLQNEVNSFLKCCTHTIACLNPEEIKIFLQLLPIRFRDRATTLLEGEYKDFNELEALIRKKLIESKPYLTLVNELRLLRQIPGEPLSAFGERVNDLYRECCLKNNERHNGEAAQAIAADLEETAIYIFKIGIINPNHKFYLLQNEEKSLKTIIEKANKLEEAEHMMSLGTTYQVLPPHTHPFNLQQTTLNQNFLPVANQGNLQPSSKFNAQTHQQRPERRQQNNHFQVRCGFCNKPNHVYADCRMRRNTPYCTRCKVYGHTMQTCTNRGQNFQKPTTVQMHTVQQQPIQSRRSLEKCEFCQRNGHKIESCFAKKKWETQSRMQTKPIVSTAQSSEN